MSKKSEGACASKRPVPRRLKICLVLLGMAAIALAITYRGPDFLLRLALNRAAELGLTYDRAEAQPFFSRVEIAGLSLAGPGGRLTVGRAVAYDLSPLSLLKRALGRGEGDSLALSFDFHDLRLDTPGGSFSADGIDIFLPSWPAPAAETVLPLSFMGLGAQNIKFSPPPRSPGLRFGLDRLQWSQFLKSELALKNLEIEFQTKAGPLVFDLAGLTFEGAGPGALERLAASEDWRALAWKLPAELKKLEAVSGRAELGESPILLLKHFQVGSVIKYIKYLNNVLPRPVPGAGRLDLDLTLYSGSLGRLGEAWGKETPATPAERIDFRGFREALEKLAGSDAFYLKLSGSWKSAGQEKRLAATLAEPGLGSLEAAIRLSGLEKIPASTAEAAAALWSARLAGFSLHFQDAGFLAKYYTWLTRSEDRAPPPALYYKERFLSPLAQKFSRSLELEKQEASALAQGLKNWLAEAEFFLDRPDSLKIAAAPDRPLPLRNLAGLDKLRWLAGLSKYDIMEKLRLTITVDGREPRPLI